jgi:hypothetical protein
MWKTGPRPSSSAVTRRPDPSGSHVTDDGQRSHFVVRLRGLCLRASATTASVTSGARCGVVTVSRTYATNRPSGETVGPKTSAPLSSTST